MSSSWGHVLRPATDEERASFAGGVYLNFKQEETTYPPQWCGVGKCREPITWIGGYQYVTGRAGRTSTARKYLCEEHATKFRTKYIKEDP